MIKFLVLIAALFVAPAHALTAAEALAMAAGESDARIEALNKAAAVADERTAAFIQALSDDAVKVAGDKVFVVRDGVILAPPNNHLVLPGTTYDVVVELARRNRRRHQVNNDRGRSGRNLCDFARAKDRHIPWQGHPGFSLTTGKRQF